MLFDSPKMTRNCGSVWLAEWIAVQTPALRRDGGRGVVRRDASLKASERDDSNCVYLRYVALGLGR